MYKIVICTNLIMLILSCPLDYEGLDKFSNDILHISSMPLYHPYYLHTIYTANLRF
jgi:hypothetical protein